jgi:para-nitrobenzyl esterase
MADPSYEGFAGLALLVSFVFLMPAPVSARSPESFGRTVQTEQGPVQGLVIDGFHTVAWLGIPYALPPVGNLRWKSPQDPAQRSQVFGAKAYGNPCPQTDPKSSEDCLYLNIWRPDTDQKNLPVFFYIHGGSNIDGSGEGHWYAVARHYNVVAVTINYRLGPMGWFLHPAFLTGDPKDDSGNFGTLDQIKALEWVQRNIERFGGDKTNVTLAGASAGAQDVSYLMHSALAKDLFHKAIIESNYPGIRPISAAYKLSKQVLYNLLVADGVVPDSKAARAHASRMTNQEIRDFLYRKSPAEIAKAYSSPDLGPINWGDLFRDDIRRETGHLPPPLVQNTDNRPEFVYVIGDGYVLPKDYTLALLSKIIC